MNQIEKIKERVEPATGKRVLGILEGKVDCALKANFEISTEELLGEDKKFQALEKMSRKLPSIGKRKGGRLSLLPNVGNIEQK